MADELEALEKNNTWMLVTLPLGNIQWDGNGRTQLSIIRTGEHTPTQSQTCRQRLHTTKGGGCEQHSSCHSI